MPTISLSDGATLTLRDDLTVGAFRAFQSALFGDTTVAVEPGAGAPAMPEVPIKNLDAAYQKLAIKATVRAERAGREVPADENFFDEISVADWNSSLRPALDLLLQSANPPKKASSPKRAG